jgi:hypothetical protein
MVSSGNFTFGNLTDAPGSDYATLHEALAAVTSLTGDLTLTQIADTDEPSSATSALSSVNLGPYKLKITTDTPHLGNPNVGHVIKYQSRFSLGTLPTSTSTPRGQFELAGLHWRCVAGADTRIILQGSYDDTHRVYDCLFNFNDIGDGIAFHITTGSCNYEIWNNFFWDGSSSSSLGATIELQLLATAGRTGVFENNTIACLVKGSAVNKDRIARSGTLTSKWTIQNNVSFNDVDSNNSDYGNLASATLQYNAAGDTTASGTGSIDNIVSGTEFKSTDDTSADFLKLAVGSQLIGAGTTPAIAGNTTGIRGNARGSTPAMGADEPDPPTFDQEGGATAHGEAAVTGAHASDSDGPSTVHGEAAHTGAHDGTSDGGSAPRGSADSTKVMASDADGASAGHGTADSTHGGASVVESGAVAGGSATSSSAHGSDVEGTSTAHGVPESTGPARIRGGARATGEASLSGAHPTDSEGGAAATGEGATTSVRSADVAGHTVGAGEASSAMTHSSAVEGKSAAHGETVTRRISVVVGTVRGTGFIGSSDVAGAVTTSRGTGEAESTPEHIGAGEGLSRAGAGNVGVRQLTSRGQQSIGILQPPSGSRSDYPFVSPKEDIQRMLGDFYLSYEDPGCELALPFRVSWLFGFGTNIVPPPVGFPTPTHTHDIIVEDANGFRIFDSTTATDFVKIPFAGRLETIEWKTGDAVCRVTRHTVFNPNLPTPVYDLYITPEDGELDGRTYRRVPLRVRSLRVGLTKFEMENVVFDAGFNVGLEPGDAVPNDGGRAVTPLIMTAIPGEGLGRQAGCEEVEPVLRRINGVGPDSSGNFKLDADGCYRVQRPTVLVNSDPRQVEFRHPEITDEEAAAALQVFNDCGPCCECDDYIHTYEGVRRLFFRYLDLGQRAEATRDQFALNKDRWERSAACRFANSIRLVAVNNGSCLLGVGGAHCNVTECCISPVVLTLSITQYVDGVAVPVPTIEPLCEDTVRAGSDTQGEFIPFDFGGTPEERTVTFGHANPGATSKFKTMLYLPGCSVNQTITLTLTASLPGTILDNEGEACPTPPSGSVSKTLAMNPLKLCNR